MEPKDKVSEYRERVARLKMGGGEKAAAKQAASGKRLARERILTLLDEGSFHEYDLFVSHECQDFGMAKKSLPGDGVITGTGTIEGFPVCIYAQDFTVAGGSLGLRHARKITKIMDHAMNLRVPLIGINDPSSSVPARAAPSTPRRSPTSCSWWTISARCSSPAPRSSGPSSTRRSRWRTSAAPASRRR